MKTLIFEYCNDKIVITITNEFLKFVSENNPDFKLKIANTESFSKAVMFELENNLGYTGGGLTGFQELVDRAIESVAEDGRDFCVLEDQIN